jgi:predicted nucleic acid-binding protein
VSGWIAKQALGELCTTSITEAEVLYGIELLAKGKRRVQLLTAAEAMFTEDFASRIFGFDSNAARAFARIAARRRGLGRPISHADAQIAAIAHVRSAKIASRNAEDFRDCDIELIDPWTAV